MFQTFSGSSRRPRQVNLSGQNLNPFAASSWSPSASGTQKTVANAQQEREQRRQERERLNASKRIQRTWRGHRSRRQLADSRRALWDEIETNSCQSSTEVVLVEQAKLLVAFFNPRRRDDVGRLANLSSRIAALGYQDFLGLKGVQPLLARLANVTLEALQMYVLPHFDTQPRDSWKSRLILFVN
jgi:ubiquitin-protein ligase E3 C